MTSDPVQEILDVLADLQLKIGVGGVPRDRILVALLPPPADPDQRGQLKRQLDDLVPELLIRYEPVGALPPAYELTRQGWLRTRFVARVLETIKVFLDAFRDHVTTGGTLRPLEWADLAAHGLTDSDYHLACIVARCFELQNGGSVQSWDGKGQPRASFVLPIDIDELIDIANADALVAKRQGTSYERLHARRVITGEITGHVRRAVEQIYKTFAATGSWPLSRTLHVQLAKAGIDLEKVASGRFARGHDIHTEGARTMLTLAGLLVPAGADDDRQLVVRVLRFLGEQSRANPEERTVPARRVMERLELDEPEITAVAKMLVSQGSAYATTASDTFDVTKMIFYLSPEFIAHAEAKELWDIILNEEEERRRWQLRSLEGSIPSGSPSVTEYPDPDEDADDSAILRDVKVPAPQIPDDLRASNPDAAWIFYSWQSDLDGKTNRNFIEECLRRATKTIRNDDSVLVDPVIDRDTRGVAGAPDIGATIFAKIETSTAFVCDVSCINRDKGGRPTPNPNVLVELGYAAKALGWDRIILILNETYGPVEDLPFDLRVKRTIRYRFAPGDAKAESRTELAKALEVGIRAILALTPIKRSSDTLDNAIAGVAEASADVGARIRDYMRWLMSELDTLKPKRENDSEQKAADEVLCDAIRLSLPLVEGFVTLADVVARHGSQDAALSMMTGFEDVLSSYDMPPNHSGSWSETDFDFQRFVGHELFVAFIMTLLRWDRLELLGRVLHHDLYPTTALGRRIKSWSALYQPCRALDDARKKRLNLNFYSVRAEFLRERHSSGNLGKSAPFEAFVEADFFLYLRSDDAWRPITAMYIGSHEPSFLARAAKRTYAERLVPALGLTDIEAFRDRCVERNQNLPKLFPTSAIHHLRQIDPTQFATR